MHFLGITAYFDDILISSDFGVKKPDSRFFKYLIKKHQINVKDAIMIGNDEKSDIAGAKKVGLFTCYIHFNISPSLSIQKIQKENGAMIEQFIMPEVDYVFSEMDMEKLLSLL